MPQAKKDNVRVVLSHKVPPELKQRLETLAKKDRRPLSGFIEIILADYADREEARERGKGKPEAEGAAPEADEAAESTPRKKAPRKPQELLKRTTRRKG